MTTLHATIRAAAVLANYLTITEIAFGLAVAGIAGLVLWEIDRAGRGSREKGD